jgi:hypothetical protein
VPGFGDNTRRLPLWAARLIQALSFAGLGILVSSVLLSVGLGFVWPAMFDHGAWLGLSLGCLLIFPLAWTADDGIRDRMRNVWLDLMAGIGGQDDLVRSAAEALAAISSRSRGATVRRSLPLLRRVCADRLIHSRRTREAAARASARIQMSSATFRRLPIACREHTAQARELPVPAGDGAEAHDPPAPPVSKER